MPVSSTFSGWRYDPANARLDFYYRGTRVGHISSSGLSTAGSGIANSMVQAAGLSANLKKGFIPLLLPSWRLIATNEIPVIAVASGGSGILASDTAPKLIRVNTSTDKQLRIQWAASSSIEITNAFPYPPDLDDTAAVTVNLLAAMGGATDTPTVAVSFWEGVGDTNAGGNTAAVTGTTITQYSVSIAAGDIGAYPKSAAISITPGAHTTDVLNLYGVWVEYTRKS